MAVAVFDNTQQNCDNPAPPLTAGGCGCSHLLVWAPVGAMLQGYERTATTSDARSLRERLVGHRIQVGGRKRRHAFQRSAESEGREAGDQRCSDLLVE